MKRTKLKVSKHMAFEPCFFSSFPPQASLSFMLFPLLSKKWPIFAKSYHYRSMCDPMHGNEATIIFSEFRLDLKVIFFAQSSAEVESTNRYSSHPDCKKSFTNIMKFKKKLCG